MEWIAFEVAQLTVASWGWRRLPSRRTPHRAKTTDRFYLDELRKKLTKREYEEWVEASRREAEALADARAEKQQAQTATPQPKPAKQQTTATTNATRHGGKLAPSTPPVKVLAEAG
ncbi:MAG: hypothetical protein R3B90_12610 [Planctomycetaceae bacterium]